MNKRGQIENWGAFALLGAIGVAVVMFMLIVWGRMDFEVNLFTKIGMFVGAIIGAGVFTKMWFED
tara:strand:+ start:321 stop:515 length:195 start_codon:yes stop_codon:yes gene_type:complete